MSIYGRLREWRGLQARALNVPSYFILSNAHLAGLALAQPTTMAELAACPGLGPKKLSQFGPALLELVAQAAAEGLEPGVEPPSPSPAAPLSDEEVAEIAAGLRLEAVRLLTRRFRGRYSAQQVEEALTRLSLSTGTRQSLRLAEAGGGSE